MTTTYHLKWIIPDDNSRTNAFLLNTANQTASERSGLWVISSAHTFSVRIISSKVQVHPGLSSGTICVSIGPNFHFYLHFMRREAVGLRRCICVFAGLPYKINP